MKYHVILCTFALVCSVSGELIPWGENVCNISIPVKKDILIEQPVSYEIRYQGICGILPCIKTRTEFRVDQSTKTIITHVEKPACCSGYAEAPGGKCAPVCLRSCNNGGQCMAPNICKCSPPPGEWTPGFVGPTCSRYTCLGENRWGSKCDKECNCPLNAYCNAGSGKCICYPGYRGANCTQECAPNSNECEETNEWPLFADPDANLILEKTGSSRQQSEALVLERTPDETLQQDDRRSFGANYLVGMLSCLSLLSVIGFLIIKRRYERLKSEVCYGSGSSAPSSNGSGSEYSSSAYYVAGQQAQLAANQNDDLLAKNLSFAVATRQILLGDDSKSNNPTEQSTEINRDKLIVNPLVESRLIRGHKRAEQNLYSEIKVNNRPLPNPDRPTHLSIDMTQQVNDEDHVYQVPKLNIEQSIDGSIAANDTSSESLYKSLNDDDSQEAIYEEIKPRDSTGQ